MLQTNLDFQFKEFSDTLLVFVPLYEVFTLLVSGVPPEIMGIGPAVAIPEVLKKANMSVCVFYNEY